MRSHKIRLMMIICLLGLFVGMVHAQEEGAAFAAAPIHFYDPPRLFTIPVAYTPKSLDTIGSGSAAFGTDASQFLGSGLIGLGDIAQFEVGTLGVLNTAKGEKSRLTNLPIVGIKFCFPGENMERVGRYLPTISAAFRRSFGGETRQDDLRYKKQLADLYIVASKNFKYGNWRGVTAHAGVDFHSAKLSTLYPDCTEESVSLSQVTVLQDGQEIDMRELSQSAMVPFFGLEVWAAPKAKLMMEFLYTADFNEEPTDTSVRDVSDSGGWLDALEDQGRVSREWMTTFGVRFFFTKFVATDIGVRYQGNFESVADANIELKLAASFPTHLIYDHIVNR